MNKIILFFVFIIQIVSCSFHSSQYDFVKTLISENKKDLKPEKNWMLHWENQKVDLYAINFDDQVIFADEEIIIQYKDWQIYKIVNLLKEGSLININSTDKSIEYIIDGRKIGLDSCNEGQISLIDEQKREYSRLCSNVNSRENYKNQIKYNSKGEIVSMQFKIHPDYPPLQLSIK